MKLKEIGKALLAIALLIYVIYDLTNGFLMQGIGYLAKNLLILALLIGITILALRKPQKYYKASQYIGFSCFFLWAVLPAFFLSKTLLLVGGLGITLSIALRRRIKSRKGGRTLDEKIKNQLRITSKSRKMNLPKGIGGFVFPILPFFHVVSRKWKGSLGQEAVIHENVHLYYLQNGWLVFVVAGTAILASLLQKMLPEGFNMHPIILLMVVASFVFFEYVTFNKTNRIGQQLGIITRKWNSKFAFKYFVIYSIQIAAVVFAIKGISFIFAVVKGFL